MIKHEKPKLDSTSCWASRIKGLALLVQTTSVPPAAVASETVRISQCSGRNGIGVASGIHKVGEGKRYLQALVMLTRLLGGASVVYIREALL